MWLPAVVMGLNESIVTVRIEEHDPRDDRKLPEGMSLGPLVGKTVTVDLSQPDVIDIIQARTVKSGGSNALVSLPLQNNRQEGPTGFEDMISLDHLHEGAILYNLRQRFFDSIPCMSIYDAFIASCSHFPLSLPR